MLETGEILGIKASKGKCHRKVGLPSAPEKQLTGVHFSHLTVFTVFDDSLAEGEGFEPSRPFWGLRDFESRAFDHSAIPPRALSVGRSVPARSFTHLPSLAA